MTFKIGDKVRKNPATWVPAPDFDAWGRGEGVGEVVDCEPDEDFVDVRWPAGRCYEFIAGLELVDEA
jgi:hypothetical protein